MIIDEADIDLVGGGSPQRSLSRRTGAPDVALRMPLKRKPGPIPRHVQLKKRCITPIPSPIPTPPASPAPPVVNGDIGNPIGKLEMLRMRGNYVDLYVADEINVPVLKLEEEIRPRSPSPPPLDVLTPPPLEPFEHYSEDAPPPLSLIADFDENATAIVNHQEHSAPSSESDADSGVDECIPNNIDDSVANGSAKCKQQVLSKKDLEEIKRYNLSIRASIYKEVRRFGKSKCDFHAYLIGRYVHRYRLLYLLIVDYTFVFCF